MVTLTQLPGGSGGGSAVNVQESTLSQDKGSSSTPLHAANHATETTSEEPGQNNLASVFPHGRYQGGGTPFPTGTSSAFSNALPQVPQIQRPRRPQPFPPAYRQNGRSKHGPRNPALNHGPSQGRSRPYDPHSSYFRADRLHPRQQRGMDSHRGMRPAELMSRTTVDWSKFRSVLITLSCVPVHTSTLDLWKEFSPWGTIVYIDIEDNAKSERTGFAKIKFDPPPKEPVRHGSSIQITIRGRKVWLVIDGVIPYPNEDGVRSPLYHSVAAKVTLKPSSLTFGIMAEPHKVMSMRTISSLGENEELSVAVDFRRRKLEITFPVFIEDKDRPELPTFASLYRLEAKFENVEEVHRVSNAKTKAIVISLEYPPRFFRRKVEVEKTHDAGRLTWGDNDLWARAVQITHDLETITKMPACLENNRQYIDLGRWTTYRLELDQDAQAQWQIIESALVDWNIETKHDGDMQLVPRAEPQLWSMLESATPFPTQSTLDLLGSAERITLPFDVRYQLEVCISHGVIEERNVTRDFLLKLQTLSGKKVQDQNRARLILEYAADQNKRVFEPMSLFEDKGAMTFYPPCTRIPAHCALVRKVTVTPTRIYFHTPTLETTNRVIRHYSDLQDNFLRVSFMDELNDGRINGSDTLRDNELYTRAFRVLNNGIRMGRWHWQFLAFGNSQIRENGAFFFCEPEGDPEDIVTCDKIREWMGRFTHIKVVAKYAARLGQCFSTTRLLHDIPAPTIVSIPDVERNGFCFTDGVGKISLRLAKMIADQWKTDYIPSAFQFRMGGCKGVLVTWPEANDFEVHIRKSQEKFSSEFNGLEIIRLSHYTTATLNRQTISILSCLGVPDSVFIDLLIQELRNYDLAMKDRAFACKLLRQYVDESQSSIMLAGMLDYGFMESNEPYVSAMLQLWRSWSIKYLKEKARIPIADSAFVLGCIDETGTLKGHINKKRRREEKPVNELPEIFLQISDPNNRGEPKIITGVCIVGRNPSLHPGDIRVVKAVDVPALRQVRSADGREIPRLDVVVFPMHGDQDIPSMCSGGDLDGDDFFVIWNQDLIPNEWFHPPMDFEPAPAKELDRVPTVQDLKMFFTLYMKNNSLPLIAHAHLAHADFRDSGAKDPRCVELAKLHSKAVDYVKTGVPAVMEKKLNPRAYPHFMEKRNTYRSNKILGQMYDRVNRVHFTPNYEMPFDKRILERYTLDNEMLKKARHIKTQYDTALKRVMGQMEIRTEFEVLSTFIMSKPRVGTAYKMHETVRRETDALKQQYKEECVEAAGKSREFKVLAPFVAAMYQVTNEEVQIALFESKTPHIRKDGKQGVRQIKPESMPMISFPWLFDGILGRIAKGWSEQQQGKTAVSGGTKEAASPAGEQPSGLDFEALKNMEYARTETGIVHRGQILQLFHHDDEDDVVAKEDRQQEEQPMENWDEKLLLANVIGTESLLVHHKLDASVLPFSPRRAAATSKSNDEARRGTHQVSSKSTETSPRKANFKTWPIKSNNTSPSKVKKTWPIHGNKISPTKLTKIPANKIGPQYFRAMPQPTATTIKTSDRNGQSSSLLDDDGDLISFDGPAEGTRRLSNAAHTLSNLTLIDLEDSPVKPQAQAPRESKGSPTRKKQARSNYSGESNCDKSNGSPKRKFLLRDESLRAKVKARGFHPVGKSLSDYRPDTSQAGSIIDGVTGDLSMLGHFPVMGHIEDEDLEVEEVVIERKGTNNAFEALANFA